MTELVATSSTRKRRFIMPLIILVIGGALVLQTSRSRATHADEARRYVVNLCKAIRDGRDLTGTLNPDDALLDEQAFQQLRQVLPNATQLALLEVAAVDNVPKDQTPKHATHQFMVGVKGIDQIGLHVQHPDHLGTSRIVGYWIPIVTPSP